MKKLGSTIYLVDYNRKGNTKCFFLCGVGYTPMYFPFPAVT